MDSCSPGGLPSHSLLVKVQQAFILIINIAFAIPIKLTQFGVSFSGVDSNFQVSMERFISDCILCDFYVVFLDYTAICCCSIE